MIIEVRTPVGRMNGMFPAADKSIVPLIHPQYGYEHNVQQLMANVIKPSWTCLDIGANFGLHTYVMSKLSKRVYAIEADLLNFSYLDRNMKKNKCSNVECIKRGVWSGPATLEFATCNSGGFSHFTFKDEVENREPHNSSYTKIDCDTFPALIENEKVDFIKMDIEGAELQALDGALSYMKEHLPFLIIELNTVVCRRNGTKAADIVDKLQEIGYNSGMVIGHSKIADITAFKNTIDNYDAVIETAWTVE